MLKTLMALLVTVTVTTAECTYEMKGEVSVGWTAYKTPMKKGVHGTFRSIVYKGKENGKSLTDLLRGATVMMQTNTVDSGNGSRDAKLVQFFFNQMDGQMLEARVADLDERQKIVLVDILMNGRGVAVPMRYRYDKGVFHAEGVLDLGDFKALPALRSINRACYDLHDGKTWQDVSVAFSVRIGKTCGK